jgi:hypothetical protein
MALSNDDLPSQGRRLLWLRPLAILIWDSRGRQLCGIRNRSYSEWSKECAEIDNAGVGNDALFRFKVLDALSSIRCEN